MLLVKTYLDKSKIEGAGIGLFAKEFIPAGTVIWNYSKLVDRMYSEEEFNKQEGLAKEFLTTYCFRFNGMFIFCGDNARFFNHSDTPNCCSEGMQQFHLGVTKTLRDIQAGEELTDDYSKFGWNEEDKIFNTIL